MRLNIKFVIPTALLVLTSCQAPDSNTSDKNPATEESRDFYFKVVGLDDDKPIDPLYVGHVASPSEICERLRHPIFTSPNFQEITRKSFSDSSWLKQGGEAVISKWIVDRGGGITTQRWFIISDQTANKINSNMNSCLKEMAQNNNKLFLNIHNWLTDGQKEPCYDDAYREEEYINDKGEFLVRRVLDDNHKSCGYELRGIGFSFGSNDWYQNVDDLNHRNGSTGGAILMLLGLREGSVYFRNLMDSAMPKGEPSQDGGGDRPEVAGSPVPDP